MSYRSIKRVFGESNLERKILVLSCICLFLLIGTSFFWVNRITEQLIKSDTVDVADSLFNAYMLDIHFDNLSMRAEMDPLVYQSFEDISNSFFDNTYKKELLALTSEMPRNQTNPKIATDPAIVKQLRRLNPQARARQQELATEKNQAASPTGAATVITPVETEEPGSASIYEGNDFIFLKPIQFQQTCNYCHDVGDKTTHAEMERLFKTDPILAKQKLERDNANAPILFAKITLPYAKTRGAIARSRAILMAFAIVTAFMSVLALYMIIRYVISKPLRHLRDVTEEVGQGRTDVRSTLNTGDEFEELSRSLNRMLRHLLDTQIALSSANADLDNKVDEQAQLNMHLYEMNRIKSDFLANMSHELRTPLNSIIGFSEVLESVDALNEKQKRYVTNIRKSGGLLLELINDILDLAKLEAGKMEAIPSEFSLALLASSLCDMVRPLAERKNIQLFLTVEHDASAVFQDQIKIRQILTNLLSNAIKFTPEGGRIKVDIVTKPTNWVVMKVTDSGVGIAECDQEVVFEKFRQGPAVVGDNALTREVSGTGLGLSIVKELCILLGGGIELESEVGKGSIFTVTLPASLQLTPKIHSDISRTIDEITKGGQKIDFARTRESPLPPANGSPDSKPPGKPFSLPKK